MRRISAVLTLTLMLSAFAFAQEQDHPLPDRWHGLIIDQSTPEDAIAALGQPSSDKPENNFRPYPLDKRISTKGKAIRQLQYKSVPGLDQVKLYFADGKLAAIYLDLKEKIAASSIPNNYGIEFEPKISSIETSSDPHRYERNQGKLYPKDFPAGYYLVGTTPQVWIAAGINNSSTGAILFGSGRGSAGDGAFPGKAENVLILSRALANREGADVLK